MRRKKSHLPRWTYGVLLLAVPLVLFNLTVAFCGHTAIFPLSPFFLREKATALVRYACHRPHCLLQDHPPLAALVASSEAKHHLPHHLLSAVIEVESGGRIHRISPAGAMGPGQLSPATAQLLKVEDPFDPQQNLEASARYLAAQVATFHDVRLALAAYNAGPGAIVNRTIPHNGETEFYVQKVMRAYAARL